MKNLKLLAFCLAILSLAMLTVPVAAQTRTAGVNPGDWFKYTITGSGNPYMWMKLQVTSVSGTNVTVLMTVHDQNGTETTGDYWVDVETGNEGPNPTQNGYFIAANLDVGDETYTSHNIMTINSTADRTYQGGSRATNYAQYAAWGIVKDCYWDKATGAAVELDMNVTSEQGTVIMSMQVTLVDSGVWVVPEFPAWAPLLALFAAFTLVAVVYKRKQLKTPTR